MKKNYDFSNAKKAKTAKSVKVVKTFRLDPDILEWLEQEGEKNGMGYQTFLNWFLKRAMTTEKGLEERISMIEDHLFKKKA